MSSENPRKLLLAAVSTYLKTPVPGMEPPAFLTDAKGRVFDNDATPPDAEALNEINVVFVSEAIDPGTQHVGGPRKRIMQMRVECYNTKSKDNADDLAWQVEEAFQANPTLNDMVEWFKLNSIDLFVVENETLALYAAVMTYEVVYWTHIQVDEGGRPTTVLLGFDPLTGPGNEPEYSDITGGA